MKFVLRFALAGLLLTAVASAQKKPDFTGHWVLNVDKSNFGKLTKPLRMSLDSKYEGGVYKSQVTKTDSQGHATTESQWYEDGKERAVNVGGPGKEKTHWDGNTLVNEQRSDDGAYLQTTKLTLSSDGKTCTQKTSSKDPNGSTNATLIWERK